MPLFFSIKIHNVQGIYSDGETPLIQPTASLMQQYEEFEIEIKLVLLALTFQR